MSSRPMKGMFTSDNGSPPICLGNLSRSVSPVASRTRSATKQQTTSSKTRQASSRWHSASGKCTRSPVEVTSSDNEHSHDPEYSAIKRSNREPQLLQMLLSKPPASNHSSSSCLISGYSTPPVESVQIVGEIETPVNQDTLPDTLLPGNRRRKTKPIEAINKGNNDSSNNVSVQINQGPSRKAVAYFKRLPAGSKEVSRQHSTLEYVQSCQNRMAEAISEYTKYLKEKDAAEARVLELTNSLSHMHLLLDQNNEAIAELEQQLGRLRLKGQMLKKDMEEMRRGIEKACEHHG